MRTSRQTRRPEDDPSEPLRECSCVNCRLERMEKGVAMLESDIAGLAKASGRISGKGHRAAKR
jgi:hypothetical protein